MNDRLEPNWDLFPHMAEVADYIKKVLECNQFTIPWSGLADRLPTLEEFLEKHGVRSFAHVSLPDGRIQVQFTKPAVPAPKSNWDDLPNVQDALDAIHAEIKEYGFSKIWQGSRKTYDVLQFHLHRMYNYETFELKELEGGAVSVQFSNAEEALTHQAEMRAQSRDLAQRPGAPPIATINWDMFNSMAAPADLIRKTVETEGQSEVWTGSTNRYNQILEYLKLLGIEPKSHPYCPVTGHTSAVFHKFQQPASAQSMASAVTLRVDATEEEMRDAIKNSSENIVSQQSPVEPSGLEHRQSESRIHRVGRKPVDVIYYTTDPFWHRRGQPSIRLSSIMLVDQVVDNKLIVHFENRHHYEMEFVSHKAALEARRSLVNLLVYNINQTR